MKHKMKLERCLKLLDSENSKMFLSMSSLRDGFMDGIQFQDDSIKFSKSEEIKQASFLEFFSPLNRPTTALNFWDSTSYWTRD